MPNYRRRRKRSTGPADYVEQVRAGKLRDPVIGFQLANGFSPIGILDRLSACRYRLAGLRRAHGVA